MTTNELSKRTRRDGGRGEVLRIQGGLTIADQLGAFLVRLGIGRMNYRVSPGLYALGQPEADSPVLVTANYKVSFDRLRSACAGRNAWILVLDTGGINVWCAAGKGTFGTEELVSRLQSSGLAEVISHRNLVLPQLSAPGVSAPAVKQASGFKVIYGPVRSRDLPRFLDSGMTASSGMRLKKFPLVERLALIPMEFIPALKWLAVILLFFLVLSGLGFNGNFTESAATHGVLAAVMLAGGMVAGTVFTPLLLPWLPGRAFSLKGGISGIITGAAILLAITTGKNNLQAYMESLGLLLLAAAFASYLGLNFTGSSTYTSLSGVKKEMKRAVPVLISGSVIGLLLWLYAGFIY